MNPRAWSTTILAATLLCVSGCGSEQVDTTYGRTRVRSINGTGALVELFRDQGHRVRTAVRLTDELADWADVIVRFAPTSGPPERAEADWYSKWLGQIGNRQMIYVVRNYSALADYWRETAERLPNSGPNAGLRLRTEKLRDEAAKEGGQGTLRPKDVAGPEDWFAVASSKDPATRCKTLEGDWSEGIDPSKAKLSRRDTLKVDAETVLLAGDDRPLVISWTTASEGRVLVVANGSFLLNGALLNPARRPLAMRTVRWIGDEPLQVAFVEGGSPLSGPPSSPSVFALLMIWPFGWVVAQLMVLGLAACLARAPRLGRPRPDPPSGEDRPVAHPEALGSLMARTGHAAEARAILESYRRWRNSSSQARVGPTPASVDPTEKPSPPESREHE